MSEALPAGGKGPRAVRPRMVVYPLVGALLALGAPGGLLVLRRVLARDPTLEGVLADVSRDSVTYGYLALSTGVVFVVLGLLVGRTADDLRAVSTTDPLTSLPNRRHFHERLLVELKRAARYGSPLSLLLIDVDRLKQINDVGGHEAGDAALCDVARALTECCRATDVAARWGGDEFVLLAPGVTAEDAVKLASRIRDTLRAEAPPGRRGGRTEVSIGVTDVALAGAADAHKLYTAADAALYLAKAHGRNRAELSSEPPDGPP